MGKQSPSPLENISVYSVSLHGSFLTPNCLVLLHQLPSSNTVLLQIIYHMLIFFYLNLGFFLKAGEFIIVIHPPIIKSQNNLLQYCSMEAVRLKEQFQNLLENNRNRNMKRVSWPCQRKSANDFTDGRISCMEVLFGTSKR